MLCAEAREAMVVLDIHVVQAAREAAAPHLDVPKLHFSVFDIVLEFRDVFVLGL